MENQDTEGGRPYTEQEADIVNRFTYHPPIPDLEQAARYQVIRDKAKTLALWLAEQCPNSRELSLAITHLEETVFWANAAIAQNEKL